MDSRLENKESNPAIVIGPIIAIVIIIIIAVALLVVYIRRGRSLKLKSSRMSGACIANEGQQMHAAGDGMSKRLWSSDTYKLLIIFKLMLHLTKPGKPWTKGKKHCLHVNILISGIYNQAFGHEISGNPLYEGCDFAETAPAQFEPSSLVSPNPLYGDMNDLPGTMTSQRGTGILIRPKKFYFKMLNTSKFSCRNTISKEV